MVSGTSRALTLDGVLSNTLTVSNSCGQTSSSLAFAVNPISVAGDQSIGVLANIETGITNNANLIYSPTNMPFASGGTGTHNDPILIRVAEGATHLRWVMDLSEMDMLQVLGVDRATFDALPDEQKFFHIRLLNLPIGGVVSKITTEIIDIINPASEPRIITIYDFGGNVSLSVPIRYGTSSDIGIEEVNVTSQTVIGDDPYLIKFVGGQNISTPLPSFSNAFQIRISLYDITGW